MGVKNTPSSWTTCSLGPIVGATRQKLGPVTHLVSLSRYGHSDFHIMDECWHSLELVALGLRNYSAIEPILSFQLQQMQETGLTLKLIRDELNSVGRSVCVVLHRFDDIGFLCQVLM